MLDDYCAAGRLVTVKIGLVALRVLMSLPNIQQKKENEASRSKLRHAMRI